MSEQRRAIVYALIAVLFWSTVSTAFKLTLVFLTPVELLLYSVSFSTLLLGMMLVQQQKILLVFQASRSDYYLSLRLGLLNPFLYYLLLFKAYDLLPAQQAQPINYTWGIALALLSVPLLKQRISWQQWLALIVSYLGVVIISTEGKPLELNFTNPLGVLLALISTLVWAFYWIYNTKDQRDPVVALFTNFLFSLPFIFCYYLFFEGFRFVPFEGILGAIYIGVFEMGICFVLWLLAMKLTNNTARISNLIFLSPFLSLIFIYFVLGEKILMSTYFGLVLIIAGLVIQQINTKKL